MAQSILARLGVVMTVDSAEFKKGLDEATIKSRAFQAELKRQNKESAQFGKDAAAVLGKVATVAAIAGAAILKAFSYADQIKDTADSLDITVGSLIRMQSAIKAAGGEAEKMGALLNKLTVNQDKASEGADNIRDAFKRLGIAGGEVDSLAPDKLFERVAYQLSQIEKPAERNALAFELLGKAAKGVDWKAYWEGYGSGKTVSEEVSAAIEAGATAWDNLKAAGTTALQAILVLAKPLADFINKIASVVSDPRRDTYSDKFNRAQEMLKDDPEYMKAGLKIRRAMIEAKIQEITVTDQLNKKEGEGTKPAAGTKKGYIKPSKGDVSTAGELAALRESFKIRVEQLSTVSQQIARETELMGLSEADAEIKKIRYALEDENLKMQLDLKKQIAIEETKGTDEARKKIDVLKQQADAYGFMTQLAGDAAEKELRIKEDKIRTQQILTNVERQGLDQLVDNFQVLGQQSKAAFAAWKAFSIVNAIIDTYTGAQKAFTSLAGIPIIGPALGAAAAGVAIAAGMMRVNMIRNQQYQGREKGGSITANTPYIVGERGPELVVPHRGGTVIPNNQLSSAMGGGMQNVYNGPYIAQMSAIDTQSAMQFLSKNKNSVWAANQSASRGMPASRS
jgi:hypothetical protein